MSKQSDEADFFLPDLCNAQSILFLVLVSELLVFVHVLFQSSFFDFSWLELGLASLFIQWLVLLSAALICNIRPWLARMPVIWATTTAYVLILVLTLIGSFIAEWILYTAPDISAEGWGRIIRNVMMASILAGIAFRYFFLTYQLRMREQAELTSRIQALQSRIRPHFLFNSMNIIASLIAVDPELAEEVVEDLSILFRASLSEATGTPVMLAEELELCEKYVHIEGLRLDDRLEMTWDIQVDQQAVRIPMLTLQPLLENAIYHGIQPLPSGGLVKVSITLEENDLVAIEIINPVADQDVSHETGNRMALENIRHRLEALYGPRASLSAERKGEKYVTRLVYPGFYA